MTGTIEQKGVRFDLRTKLLILIVVNALLLMVFIEGILIPQLGGFFGSLLLFIAVLVRKVLPCLIIGKSILTSTEVSEFVATLWKMRFPQSIIIPVSVVFRYFPTLREEWQSLRMAMKMRGIGLSVEHVMVPLMMSAVNISEELSAAALCRGLDQPGATPACGRCALACPTPWPWAFGCCWRAVW